MGRKRKYTIEVMVNTVIEIIEGKSSISIKALELELNQNTISQRLTGYERSGIEYFESRARNNTYTKEFKEVVISEYQAGGISYSKLALKYDIRSHSIIINWVRKYNRLEVIKDYDPKGEVYMSKGRKTTHEEKIEIVQYCINNNSDGKMAANNSNPKSYFISDNNIIKSIVLNEGVRLPNNAPGYFADLTNVVDVKFVNTDTSNVYQTPFLFKNMKSLNLLI